MLFPYKYPKAKIQNVQSFVDYIMLEIVLKAKNFTSANLPVEKISKPYRDLIMNVNSTYILDPLKKMYQDARKLDQRHINILRNAVSENNKIEQLCKGIIEPIRYVNLTKDFTKDNEKDIIENIKIFCKNLYDKCLERKPFYTEYGKIKDYHDSLVGSSTACPFCGQTIMFTKYSKLRNAFDHYLPKSRYPFTSVNFHNLVPACPMCNSSFKRDVDVLFIGKRRTKAFYPFTKEQYDIHIDVHLKKSYREDLTPSDVELTFSCKGHDEEVKNWLRVYHIEDRYKEYCCSSEIKQTLKSMKAFSKVWLKEYIRMLGNSRNVDMNFLKIPFFEEALKTLGINVA